VCQVSTELTENDIQSSTRYQEVSKALKISVVEKVSYRDALVKVKSDVLQRTTDRV